MGAWDTGIFENDSALDFMDDLIEEDDASMLNEILYTFDQPSGILKIFSSKKKYIDQDMACSGLVACEVIAAIGGKPSDDMPAELSEWIRENNIEITDKEKVQSKGVVKKVKVESELRELWQETEYYSEWLVTIEDLEKRLNNI